MEECEKEALEENRHEQRNKKEHLKKRMSIEKKTFKKLKDRTPK